MQDRELIQRIVEDDDPEAFGTLVRRHQGKVYRLAISILGPGGEAAAEDVAQEALLRAYRKLGGFRRESRFTSWLYRITRNLAIDAVRRPHHARPHVDDEILTRHPAEEQESPEVRAIAAERARRVEACVRRLPPRWQSTFRLHYWLGHTVEEIAELLEQPSGTIKSHLHRGRKLLAHCLQEGEQGHP